MFCHRILWFWVFSWVAEKIRQVLTEKLKWELLNQNRIKKSQGVKIVSGWKSTWGEICSVLVRWLLLLDIEEWLMADSFYLLGDETWLKGLISETSLSKAKSMSNFFISWSLQKTGKMNQYTFQWENATQNSKKVNLVAMIYTKGCAHIRWCTSELEKAHFISAGLSSWNSSILLFWVEKKTQNKFFMQHFNYCR